MTRKRIPLNVGRSPRRVATYKFKAKVQRLAGTADTPTYRVTLPQALAMLLDIEKGDTVEWVVDTTSRGVSFSKKSRTDRPKR
jgi:hypothetical protein